MFQQSYCDRGLATEQRPMFQFSIVGFAFKNVLSSNEQNKYPTFSVLDGTASRQVSFTVSLVMDPEQRD